AAPRGRSAREAPGRSRNGPAAAPYPPSIVRDGTERVNPFERFNPSRSRPMMISVTTPKRRELTKMRTMRMAAAAAIAGFGLFAGATASAKPLGLDTGGVIYACYQANGDDNGKTLRLVPGPGMCKKNEES